MNDPAYKAAEQAALDWLTDASLLRLEEVVESLLEQAFLAGVEWADYGVVYLYEDFASRLALVIKDDITFSNQYGMLLLLNKDNEILLNLTPLVEKEERMKHS